MSEDIEREAFEVVKWLQASRLTGYEITAIQAAESIKRLMNQYRASNTLIEEQAARIAGLGDLLEEKRENINSLRARLSEAVKVLEWVNAELKDHGYAEIGTLRETVINAIGTLGGK